MNEILRFLASVPSSHAFSDVHIEQGLPIKLRLPTGWADADFGPVDEIHLRTFLQSIDEHWRTKINNRIPVMLTVDLDKFKLGSMRYRCSVYTIDGDQKVAASLRPIGRIPMTLDKIGLPPIVQTYVRAPKGLLLVTGPTGAGKTTTIMALLAKILSERPVHVLTLEDPIEYSLSPDRGIVSQREVGLDTESFAAGLKDALRQRPDIIMVGELRDRDTAITALRAAESGHFVVATMHARSSIGAVRKLAELAETDAVSISYSLVGVIAQTLLPSTDVTKSILASEILHCADKEVPKLLAEANWTAISNLLRNGEKGCSSLNKSLATLVAGHQASREHALVASYDATGLHGLVP